MDFRKFLRVPVGIPAVISWADPNGLTQRRKVVARDMSAKGMFLYAESPPPVGSAVELEIHLPLLRNVTSALRIKADARVVRIQPPGEEQEEQISGFAVITDRFTLQEQEEEARQ